MDDSELKRASELADYLSGYSNALCKECNLMMLKLIGEVNRLKNKNQEDWKYMSYVISENNYREESNQNSYNCGEL